MEVHCCTLIVLPYVEDILYSTTKRKDLRYKLSQYMISYNEGLVSDLLKFVSGQRARDQAFATV